MAKVKLTFIGKRFNRGLVSAFLHNGETVFFKRVKYCHIGTIYEGVTKGKDGLQMEIMPRDLGQSDASEQTVEAWRLEEKEAEQIARRIRDTNRINKSRALKDVANILRPYCKNKVGSSIRAIVDLVVDEILREERQKELAETNKSIGRMLKKLNKERAKNAK